MHDLSRKRIKYFLRLVDTCIILASGFLTHAVLTHSLALPTAAAGLFILILILLYLLIGNYFRLFSKINRYFSIKEMIQLYFSVGAASVLSAILTLGLTQELNLAFVVLTFFIALFTISLSRMFWRLYTEHQQKARQIIPETSDRILVVGAGEGGSIFINHIQTHTNGIDITGIIDDDPSKQGTYLYGHPVLGGTEDLERLVRENRVDSIIIAIPSLAPEKFDEIVSVANRLKIDVKKMPSVEDTLLGRTAYQEVELADLLNREEVEIDLRSLQTALTNKVILVTGAGGSIGSEIVRQVSQFGPKQVLLLGHGENSIYAIDQEIGKKHPAIEFLPIIADIQDQNRIRAIMDEYQPDYVFHAAAHKHVPLMEYNPTEAVKNNVYGTYNLARAASNYGVDKFVMVSTDKANNPTNVMGATKRLAEMIVAGMNEDSDTVFSAVRFGNVLGSNGSVIPLFKRQIEEGGPITITDKRMARFFMTIPEAAKLVIQAGIMAEDGELFVLDMGEPVKIIDLAKNLIKLSGYHESQIQIVEIGIRPGEKLYEELLLDDEKTNKKVFDKIFVGRVKNDPLDEIFDFVDHLDLSNRDNDHLSKQLVDYVQH